MRAFEFHDHYCPGVTAGIFMVNYLKKHFNLSAADACFVQSLDPWCKDDALMVLLNATPGKRRYAASYPALNEAAGRAQQGSLPLTVFYLRDGKTKRWQGIALDFRWAQTGCGRFKNGLIRRLCDDLWYLKRLDQPEEFVAVVKAFELAEGTEPRSLAEPHPDVAEKLGFAVQIGPQQ
jgi:formylmethanofuran dehydrogenase subunit E-like metal-binding protein